MTERAITLDVIDGVAHGHGHGHGRLCAVRAISTCARTDDSWHAIQSVLDHKSPHFNGW